VLHSFSGSDGFDPEAGLIANSSGGLYGTTYLGGSVSNGTVFEVTGSGFVVPITFGGTPGQPNCQGKSVSALAQQYGGLNGAAAALGYSDVSTLQSAIMTFCKG
jgi:hypothetical protein